MVDAGETGVEHIDEFEFNGLTDTQVIKMEIANGVNTILLVIISILLPILILAVLFGCLYFCERTRNRAKVKVEDR